MKREFDISAVGRKPQRFPQTIWLSYESFKGVLDLAGKLNVATNVICASIVEQFFGQENVLDHFKSKKETIKVTEFRCPFCLSDTPDLMTLKFHILECEEAKSAFLKALEVKTGEVSRNE